MELVATILDTIGLDQQQLIGTLMQPGKRSQLGWELPVSVKIPLVGDYYVPAQSLSFLRD